MCFSWMDLVTCAVGTKILFHQPFASDPLMMGPSDAGLTDALVPDKK